MAEDRKKLRKNGLDKLYSQKNLRLSWLYAYRPRCFYKLGRQLSRWIPVLDKTCPRHYNMYWCKGLSFRLCSIVCFLPSAWTAWPQWRPRPRWRTPCLCPRRRRRSPSRTWPARSWAARRRPPRWSPRRRRPGSRPGPSCALLCSAGGKVYFDNNILFVYCFFRA